MRYLDLEAQVSAGEDNSPEEDGSGTSPVHDICYQFLTHLRLLHCPR